MNQQNTVPPMIEPQKKFSFDAGKIKIIILSVLLLAAIVTGSLIWLNYSKQQDTEILAANDKVIIDNLYEIRLSSLHFYEKNYSYKDWTPNFQIVEEIKTLGSEVVLKKPDYQSYIMYAYLPSEKKIFLYRYF